MPSKLSAARRRAQGPTGAYPSVKMVRSTSAPGSESMGVKQGVPQNTVSGGRGDSVRYFKLFDDKWHDIAAVRRVLSDRNIHIEVWVDGRREALVEGVEGDGPDGGAGALPTAPALPVGHTNRMCSRRVDHRQGLR